MTLESSLDITREKIQSEKYFIASEPDLVEDVKKSVKELKPYYERHPWLRFGEAIPIVLYRFIQGVGWTLFLATLAAQMVAIFALGVPMTIVAPLCLLIGLFSLCKGIYNQIKRIREINTLKDDINMYRDDIKKLRVYNIAYYGYLVGDLRLREETLTAFASITKRAFDIKSELRSKFQHTWLQKTGYFLSAALKLTYAFLSGFGLSLTIITFFLPLVLSTPTGLSVTAVYLISSLVGLFGLLSEVILSRRYEDKRDALTYEVDARNEKRECYSNLNSYYKGMYITLKAHQINVKAAAKRKLKLHAHHETSLDLHSRTSSDSTSYDSEDSDEEDSPTILIEESKAVPSNSFLVEEPSAVKAVRDSTPEPKAYYGRWTILRVLEAFPVVIYRFVQGVGWTLFLTTLAAQVITTFSFGVPLPIVAPMCLLIGIFSLCRGIYYQVDRIHEINELKDKINSCRSKSLILEKVNEMYCQVLKHVAQLRDIVESVWNTINERVILIKGDLTRQFTFTALHHVGYFFKASIKYSYSFLSGFGLSLSILTFFLPLVLSTPTGLPMATVYFASCFVGLLDVIAEAIVTKLYEQKRDALTYELSARRNKHECNTNLNHFYNGITTVLRKHQRDIPNDVKLEALDESAESMASCCLDFFGFNAISPIAEDDGREGQAQASEAMSEQGEVASTSYNYHKMMLI